MTSCGNFCSFQEFINDGCELFPLPLIVTSFTDVPFFMWGCLNFHDFFRVRSEKRDVKKSISSFLIARMSSLFLFAHRVVTFVNLVGGKKTTTKQHELAH